MLGIRVLFLFLSCFSISLAQNSPAYSPETIPNPKPLSGGYVSNPDSILSEAEVQKLNGLIQSLEDSSTAQIAIVIVNSIGDLNPKDFSTELFNVWGIGYADKDNGLLIFTVLDQRRTEFETGYGLEGLLPDVLCYQIGMQELVPYFKESQYGAGLEAALLEFIQVLENPDTLEDIYSNQEVNAPVQKDGENSILPYLSGYILLNLFFHLGLTVLVLINLKGKQDLYDKYMGIRWGYSFIWIILFPLPYLFVYLYLKKLLEKLRNAPRYSKVNGDLMHKLNEEEDDAFLASGQVTEEEIGSVDYDAWVTDNKADILILRYAKRFSKYRKCPKCTFKAYYLAYNRTVVPATYSSSGRGEKKHACKNCSYSRIRTYVIAQKQRPKSNSSSGSSSSSGGSSWGGGSSGGGGSGVSW